MRGGRAPQRHWQTAAAPAGRDDCGAALGNVPGLLQFFQAVHAKDGEYPTSGRNFGSEKPLGQGRVNLPAILAKLAELGYDGAITIEREVEENWEEDVRAGKLFLEEILTSLEED